MGKSIKIFPSEICCVIVPKLLVLEAFDVYSLSGFMSRFSVELLLSGSAKNFVGEPFSAVLQRSSVSENFY